MLIFRRFSAVADALYQHALNLDIVYHRGLATGRAKRWLASTRVASVYWVVEPLSFYLRLGWRLSFWHFVEVSRNK